MYSFEWLAKTNPGVSTSTGAPVMAPIVFTVNVLGTACTVTAVTPMPMPPINYDIGVGGRMERPLPQISVQPPECASFVKLQWSVASTFVTFDNIKKVLVIETTDTTAVGPHTVDLTISIDPPVGYTLGPNVPKPIIYPIQLQIHCFVTSIGTSSPTSAQTYYFDGFATPRSIPKPFFDMV